MRPYLVGIGIGVLSWLVFAIVAQPLGITTALSEVSGAVTGLVTGSDFVKANSYWAKTMPAWDYGTLFLIGTLLGGLIGAVTSGGFKVEPAWKNDQVKVTLATPVLVGGHLYGLGTGGSKTGSVSKSTIRTE